MLKNTKSILKRSLIYILKGIPTQVTNAQISYLQPNNTLKNKTILITGGGRGLGFSMAKKFISEGAVVVIVGRNRSTLQKASEILGCQYLTCDICDTKQFEVLFDKVHKMVGAINCLVCNAGISLHEGRFMDVTEESFDKQISTNLRGSYFLTQKYLKYVEKNEIKRSNILLISSEKGIFVDDMPYGLTKCAINSFGQALANDYCRKGVRVNVIAPGVTVSDMTGANHREDLTAPFNMNYRYYLPEEVAEVANFLLSDASVCLSGQILACNEGKTVNRPLEIKLF